MEHILCTRHYVGHRICKDKKDNSYLQSLTDLEIKKLESIDSNKNLNGTYKIFEEVTSGFKELVFERLHVKIR